MKCICCETVSGTFYPLRYGWICTHCAHEVIGAVATAVAEDASILDKKE